MWFRRRSRRQGATEAKPADVLFQPGVTGTRSTPGPVPDGYATVLVGNVVRIPQLATFADTIDPAALDGLTETYFGVGKHEVVGVISRSSGNFRWKPHPAFARAGVPPIQVDRADLTMVIQPGPTTPTERALTYSIFLTPCEELDFWLKDLHIP